MLAADDRLVGIVVEIDQLASPADPDRLLRSEHDAHGGLEAGGPVSGCSDRRTRPIEALHHLCEFSAADEQPLRISSTFPSRKLSPCHEFAAVGTSYSPQNVSRVRKFPNACPHPLAGGQWDRRHVSRCPERSRARSHRVSRVVVLSADYPIA